MSNVSSSQSSVGQLILASKRMSMARQGSTLGLLGNRDLTRPDDARSLYGQLAQKFLARRGAGQSDEAGSALARAAAAAAGAGSASKSVSSRASSSNADGDVVSLTKATNFRRSTVTGPSVQPSASASQPPVESITQLESGNFDVESGVFKSSDELREGRFTFSDESGRIDLTITRNAEGSMLASGAFRAANGEVREFSGVKMTDATVVQFGSGGSTTMSMATVPSAAPSGSLPASVTSSGDYDSDDGDAPDTMSTASTTTTPTTTTTPRTTASPTTSEASTSPRSQPVSREMIQERLSGFGGSVSSTSVDGRVVRFSINGQAGDIRFNEDGTVDGTLGTRTESRVRFSVNASGELAIDLATGNADADGATRENAIRVRTLLNRQTSTGEVGGSGMYAAAGSRVITTGNATADSAMLTMEQKLRESGGTLQRADGSSGTYSFAVGLNSGSFTMTGTRASGRMVAGVLSTNFSIDLANVTERVSTSGSLELTQAVTRTVMNGLYGRS